LEGMGLLSGGLGRVQFIYVQAQFPFMVFIHEENELIHSLFGKDQILEFQNQVDFGFSSLSAWGNLELS